MLYHVQAKYVYKGGLSRPRFHRVIDIGKYDQPFIPYASFDGYGTPSQKDWKHEREIFADTELSDLVASMMAHNKRQRESMQDEPYLFTDIQFIAIDHYFDDSAIPANGVTEDDCKLVRTLES